jgi:hypothetical protein
VVNPATLTVTTPSATKTFDGTALASVGTLTGLVNGETATFTTTGNQTEVGTSANTYEIAWDGTALQGNYTVVENLGTLTVNAAPVVPAPAATPVTPAAVVAAIPAVVGAAVAAAPAAVAAAPAAVAAAVGAGAPAAPADETTIDDDANPLANYEADAECWVHWLMIIGMIISAIYGAAVVGRRARYTNKIESIEDSIL